MFFTNTDMVNFGEWDGYTHAVYILKIKNNFAKELELTGYHLHTNAFTFDNNLFPMTLAPDEEKNINLLYYPWDIDSNVVNDVLTINSDINSDTLIQRIAIQVKLTGTKIYSSVESISMDPVRVYPNPVKDMLTISSQMQLKGKVSIYSMNGTLVYERDI